jgi:hypothetical protein
MRPGQVHRGWVLGNVAPAEHAIQYGLNHPRGLARSTTSATRIPADTKIGWIQYRVFTDPGRWICTVIAINGFCATRLARYAACFWRRSIEVTIWARALQTGSVTSPPYRATGARAMRWLTANVHGHNTPGLLGASRPVASPPASSISRALQTSPCYWSR